MRNIAITYAHAWTGLITGAKRREIYGLKYVLVFLFNTACNMNCKSDVIKTNLILSRHYCQILFSLSLPFIHSLCLFLIFLFYLRKGKELFACDFYARNKRDNVFRSWYVLNISSDIFQLEELCATV